jgi:hypothetical protein
LRHSLLWQAKQPPLRLKAKRLSASYTDHFFSPAFCYPFAFIIRVLDENSPKRQNFGRRESGKDWHSSNHLPSRRLSKIISDAIALWKMFDKKIRINTRLKFRKRQGAVSFLTSIQDCPAMSWPPRNGGDSSA